MVQKNEKKIDKRRLKTRKLVVKTEINERNNTIFVEMGPNITDVNVFESIIHIIHVTAERLDMKPDTLWHLLSKAFNENEEAEK